MKIFKIFRLHVVEFFFLYDNDLNLALEITEKLPKKYFSLNLILYDFLIISSLNFTLGLHSYVMSIVSK